ncbi:MAG: hypothetical protein MUE86_05730 [Thiobacillaceae bacterium]|nr:hypothetical protein [Thiobacillaceae bacterium]
MQLAFGVDGLDVQGDVLGRGLEQRGHFRLGDPNGAALGPQLDGYRAVIGGVEDEFAFGHFFPLWGVFLS